MNPSKALASWHGRPEPAALAGPSTTAGEVLRAWSEATGVSIPKDELVVATGIRDLLAAVFSVAAERRDQLWLPEDVYPVYWEAARAAGHQPQAFRTLPAPDWAPLHGASPRATLLLPLPLSPLGRWLTANERDHLLRWLRAGDRTLIVDTVYTYDFTTARTTLEALRGAGACIVSWSCSKAWLRPGAFGVARAPAAWVEALQARCKPASSAALADLLSVLTSSPHLPASQQQAFDRQWRRLAPRIRAALPAWQPPPTGYFSLVARGFEELVNQHALLAVPASVFGSAAAELSVITCLHDLAANERDAERA